MCHRRCGPENVFRLPHHTQEGLWGQRAVTRIGEHGEWACVASANFYLFEGLGANSHCLSHGNMRHSLREHSMTAADRLGADRVS